MAKSSDGRLDTWKQIAEFLGREVRTVQRWEKTEGLPIHRHRHAKLDSIYAFESELSQWRLSRRLSSAAGAGSGATGEIVEISTPQTVFALEQAVPVETAIESEAWPSSASDPIPASPSRRVPLGWLAATLACAMSAIGLLVSIRHKSGHLGADLTPVLFSSPAEGRQYSPSFSPDGKKVLFSWTGPSGEDFELYTREIGKETEERLTHDAANDLAAVWSPDGREIAFCRIVPKHRAELRLLDVRTRQQRKLADLHFSEPVLSRAIGWLPDSGGLVFADVDAFTGRSTLYVLNIRKGIEQAITFPPLGSHDVEPSVSVRGSVAYVRDEGLGSCSLRLVQLNRNASEASGDRNLNLPDFDHLYINQPAWTPDGNHLVFVSTRGAQRRLWITSIESDPKPELLPLGAGLHAPAISSDGQLAYSTSTMSVNIWRTNLQGNGKSQPVRVLTSQRSQDSPKVSPDGKKIAYATNRNGAINIWVSDIDGHNAVPVTSIPGLVTGSPAWSPDGSQIAFDSRADGKPAIYLVASNGGQIKKITGKEYVSATPAWSADGRFIYFSSDRSGRMEIWRVTPTGDDPIQVTEDGGSAPQPSPDGVYLYYTKTGASFSSLRQLNLSDGQDSVIEPSVFDRGFAPVRGGVYYCPESHLAPYSLYFYSIGSRKKQLITSFDRPPHYGMSVSPDGRDLYFSKVDVDQQEIMLVKGFWR